jgi:hypothetical protein
MAFYELQHELQHVRRNDWNHCKSPQRFGPDLVVFPAVFSREGLKETEQYVRGKQSK